jgi:hypothetical protein
MICQFEKHIGVTAYTKRQVLAAQASIFHSPFQSSSEGPAADRRPLFNPNDYFAGRQKSIHLTVSKMTRGNE